MHVGVWKKTGGQAGSKKQTAFWVSLVKVKKFLLKNAYTKIIQLFKKESERENLKSLNDWNKFQFIATCLAVL